MCGGGIICGGGIGMPGRMPAAAIAIMCCCIICRPSNHVACIHGSVCVRAHAHAHSHVCVHALLCVTCICCGVSCGAPGMPGGAPGMPGGAPGMPGGAPGMPEGSVGGPSGMAGCGGGADCSICASSSLRDITPGLPCVPCVRDMHACVHPKKHVHVDLCECICTRTCMTACVHLH